MADEEYTFTQARTRLEEIVTQVRGKEVSLEQSLDLLEEGVRLANVCTELSDHTEWRTVAEEGDANPESDDASEALADEDIPAEAEEDSHTEDSAAEGEPEDSDDSESGDGSENEDSA